METTTTAHEASFDEVELINDRLEAVQKEAEAGEHTLYAVRFMASFETDLVLRDPPPAHIAFWEHKDDPRMPQYLRDHNIAPAKEYRPAPTPEKEKDILEVFHKEAAEYVQAISARSPAESARKQRWLDQIPSFGLVELVNFRLYKEFSKPTLGPTGPKKHATYEELQAVEASEGWLEFRFGTDIYQEGWYDNPEGVEIRQNPCPPVEAVRRQEIIAQRFVDIAGEYGMFVHSPLIHTNLSAFAIMNEGNEQQAVPLLGSAADRDATTQDALSGVMAALKEGAWMTLDTARNKDIYTTHSTYKISPLRRSIRVLEDYIELRSQGLQHNASQSLLWLTSSILDGLQRQKEHFETQGHEVPAWRMGHQVLRTAEYRKLVHLRTLRGLERLEQDKNGAFHLSEEDARHFAKRSLDAFTGFTPDLANKDQATETSTALNLLVANAVQLSKKGRPYVDMESLQAAYTRLSPQTRSMIHIPLDEATIQTLATRANKRFSVFRFKPRMKLEGVVRKEALSPRDRSLAHLGSTAMRIAYGPYHHDYAMRLRQAAHKAVGDVL